jgi:predicted ATPase/class 3 adenylate cyclase/DNA-binding XRE family transcriptional regulator
MGEMQSFGKWLRHRRRELDLTQDELAHQVGCAPITIRKLEGDEMHPSKQLAESIGEQLGIPLNQRVDFVRFARNEPAELSPDHAGFISEFLSTRASTGGKAYLSERSLPSGTVTLLFCNIGGSIQEIQGMGEDYVRVLEEHQSILQNAFTKWKGHVMDRQGDSFFVVFIRSVDAIAAAIESQQALVAGQGEQGRSLPVQMGIHTGEPMLSNQDYIGADVHRASRICAAAHPGQILVSDETRVLVERHLPEGASLRGLGRFWLKDLEEPEDIYQLVMADVPSDFPPLNSLEVMPNNLPVQYTSFIGRNDEIAEISRLLGSSRLITLTGAGGTGKTRLAIEVAGNVLNQFPDGVWLIDFASLHEPALVQQMIATALRVREEPNRKLIQTLIDYLRPKNLLLLFDNCEHLVATCAEVADTLLQTCPNLRIFVTSREAFGIAGENQYHVPSLSLPTKEQELSLEALNQSEAVLVFLDRAVSVQRNFKLTPANASAVAQICWRLDGIPLAIELAAARIKTLSVEQIAAHLDDRFRLLNTGNRAALPRQQTLRATIDWSYNLLSDKERILLGRLSVFAGGWTLEAARTVCSENKVKGQDIFELLLNLVDKSLVLVEEKNGDTRYRFLETIRVYASEKLMDAGDEGQMREHHLEFYTQLSKEAEEKFKGKEQLLWLGIMESERENLRSALDYAAHLSAPDSALLLIGTAFWLWFFRGPWSEGQRLAEVSLQASSDEKTNARARALMALGLFKFLQSDYPAAKALLNQSLGLWKEIGNPWWCAFILAFLGQSLRVSDRQTANELFTESLNFAKETHDSWILAFSLWINGENELYRKNLPEASRLLEESLQLSRSLEDRMLQNEVLRALGGIAESKQEYGSAVDLYEQSLAINRELGDTTTISLLHYDLGRAYQLTGKNEEAARHFMEAVKWSHRLGKKAGTLRALAGLGVVAAARGQARRAICLLVASNLLIANLELSYSFTPNNYQSAWVERSLAAARHQLGEDQYEAARVKGESMTLDQAIIYSLKDEQGNDLDF